VSRHKAPYASQNHGDAKLGLCKINDWFRGVLPPENTDPRILLNALASSPFVDPGSPETSSVFELMNFQTGPMLGVFTPAVSDGFRLLL
jgi:hypothetical protein